MFSYAKVIKKIEVARFKKGFFKCFLCQEGTRRLGSRRSMATQRKVIEKYMWGRLGKRGGSGE